MFQIELQDEFCASHYIRLNGQWEQPHSHTWRVRVFLGRKQLDKDCVVVDFEKARKMLRNILDKLDNKELNSIRELGKNPTAEIVARYLYDELNCVIGEQFPQVILDSIAVCEQAGCWARYGKQI